MVALSNVIALLLVWGSIVAAVQASYMEDGEGPEGYDDDDPSAYNGGVREKVTIGVIQRPEKCADPIVEGSKALVELSLWKMVPSSVKAGEMEKVEVMKDKEKIIIAGSGRFLEGVENGVLGACPGEKRSIRIPASLGFGEEGSKKLRIPPDSDLRASVTVLKVAEPDPYGGDNDEMAPDEDMDEYDPEGREDGEEQDDDDERLTGADIPDDQHFHYIQRVNAASFDELAAKKNLFVMFFAPWCGHCTAVKPKFAKVARAFQTESKVAIIGIDATEEEDLAARVGVEGFPTFVLIKQGKLDQPIKFNDARTVHAMVAAVNDAFGLERLPNGRLSEFAGTVAALNVFVDQWQQGAISLNELTRQLPEGSYYKRVVESVEAHGKEYIAKEKQRLAKMMDKGTSVKPEQLDSMQRRYNILNVFHNERHQEPPMDD